MRNTKTDLLDHYANCDIHEFTQIDGWIHDYPNTNIGSLDQTDKDGDCINAGLTKELRRSSADLAVRIFIHKGTESRDAIRLIKKMLNWIETHPELLTPKLWAIENWGKTNK